MITVQTIVVDRLRYTETIESSITVELLNDSVIVDEFIDYWPVHYPVSDQLEIRDQISESWTLKQLEVTDAIETTDRIRRRLYTPTMIDLLIIEETVERYFILNGADDDLTINDEWSMVWGLRNFTVSDTLITRETHTVQGLF